MIVQKYTCGQFTTFTFGYGSTFWEREVSRAILEVRQEGHGPEGFKKKQIFPKLVFIYDENMHDTNKEFEYLFDKSVETSGVAMYPDYIGTNNYLRHGKIVSPMGKIYCPTVLNAC